MSIEVRGIAKRFGGFMALDNVDLVVPSGELVALLGPSGGGKTTLLRIIAGLETPDAGSILFHGEDATERMARERQVGFVFQHYALFRHMSVFENVAFGLRVRPRRVRPAEPEIRERVMELLALVQLDFLADRFPSQLSGGQRQRVALARALAVRPKVLLLDEPFGALDAKVRKELRRWLRRLHDEVHVTSVFVTHDQEEAMEVADRVVIINEGRIEQQGTPQEVYEAPASPFVYGFLGDVNLFHGRLHRGRMDIGGPELDLPEFAEAVEQSALAYVRTHELDVASAPNGHLAIEATIRHFRFHGSSVLLELDRVSDGQVLEAEIPRAHFDELRLAKGQRVFLSPEASGFFRPANLPRPSERAEVYSAPPQTRVPVRAIVKTAPGPGMEVREVPTPAYGPSDVLIKVHAAGVCGTDLHIWEWDAWASNRLKPPVVIGHEFAGVIEALGAEASAEGLLAVGDRVTAEGHIVCGHCLQCRTGHAHLCSRTRIIGVDRDGAFADFISMPASNVMKLDGIPMDVGAIMDPTGNAVHTVLEGGDVPGSTVFVLGCGPIGCFACGVAKAAGASLVIASDYNDMRLSLAQKMGADVILNPGRDDVLARIRELTGGDGVDLVCEMSGHPDGHSQAFAAARLGGRVNLLGTPSRTTQVDFARDVIFKGLTLYGVTGRKMYTTWQQMARFLRNGQLDPLPVVTHRFPLEGIAEAIGVIKDGKAGKVILEIAK